MTSFVVASILSMASLGASPAETYLVDHVDLIEINHLYDLQGRLVIDQLIFYQWDSASQRFQVRAWRLLKTNDQLPRKSWNQDKYICHWRDMNVHRKVYADNVRETWTTSDPEVLERNMLPIEQRSELSQPDSSSSRLALASEDP
ncbi:hypothetical protein [Blastopirellula marina]|uniref:Uncharacterized protein n=1 Tax=Blastopirellula marina TaxID=124 RepID=A0A2S8FWW6_9BACT|nr:hypothetical protein [Blastopirellula marina]PQO36668.1 hypothetical protein C5Y98_11795 [Blastopirellula marina]PTL44498.1 hypothetical protein C5Y97_11805 [Blastopirellula marina]